MFRQSFTGSALLSSLWFDSSTGLSPPSVQLSSCVLLSPHNLLGPASLAIRHDSRRGDGAVRAECLTQIIGGGVEGQIPHIQFLTHGHSSSRSGSLQEIARERFAQHHTRRARAAGCRRSSAHIPRFRQQGGAEDRSQPKRSRTAHAGRNHGSPQARCVGTTCVENLSGATSRRSWRL